jgi:hypothetical protein
MQKLKNNMFKRGAQQKGFAQAVGKRAFFPIGQKNKGFARCQQ